MHDKFPVGRDSGSDWTFKRASSSLIMIGHSGAIYKILILILILYSIMIIWSLIMMIIFDSDSDWTIFYITYPNLYNITWSNTVGPGIQTLIKMLSSDTRPDARIQPALAKQGLVQISSSTVMLFAPLIHSHVTIKIRLKLTMSQANIVILCHNENVHIHMSSPKTNPTQPRHGSIQRRL